MVTIAHRVEVEVGADGPASAPHSGATAAEPPAGALRRPKVVGEMETVHGFGGWVSPTGIVAIEMCDALRGKSVDEVGAPQRVQVSEHAWVVLPIIFVYFAAESVGPDVGRGSNVARGC
jgi:hypothetical protein